ncbi:MFS transporter [Rhodococcus sp. T2V]|uniref:MFS transporter n=1 Tax=Rhodococcus sp. T2V TaxID=3034164 RepID=UPI0023E21D8E|nr:MFS transporter [Rhodococcus sp. T2V]MDF3313099.1 MFS transporter [Rhodococcus sp. T2V]
MLLRSVAGVALEYYDFTVFATFAPFFASQFFVKEDNTAAILSVLAVFAAGFLARPLGAVVLGWVADSVGRKRAMITAMLLTAGASLVIGVLPSFEAIGPAAAVLLTIARIVQGFGHGGESTSAYVFVSELAPPSRRGRYSSLYPIALMLGIISATLLGAILTSVLSHDAVSEWGWRIPFLLGGVLGIFALVLRRSLRDSDAFEQAQSSHPKISARERWGVVWQHRTGVLRVLGLTAGMTVAYYFWAVNATTYAISAKGADPSHTFWASLAAQAAYLCVLPLWGRFSDRFGRRPNYMIASGMLAVLAFPLSLLLDSNALQTGIAIGIALCFLASATSVEPAFFSELFPTHVRATAIALPLAIGIALFGGTAPYLSTWLSSIGKGWLFTVYAIVLALITFTVALKSPEVAGKNFESDSTS